MADLFEADIETLRQHMDIVAQGFRGTMEGLIGHHDRCREIVRQRDPVEPARRIVEGTRAVDDRIEAAAAFGKAYLEGDLERAAGAINQFRNQELPAMTVEPPQRLTH